MRSEKKIEKHHGNIIEKRNEKRNGV